MASLPVEILFGVYLGILTGIVPGLVSWALGFLFRYFTGVSIPGFGVVVLAVAIAGVQGGLLALTDPQFTQVGQERFVVALLVVLMLSLYAHAKGDKWGEAFPRKLSLDRLRNRTLSTDVVEFVGGRHEVRVRVTGDVGDIEGYPPLPADLRAAIRDEEWTFPADLPLGELETRVADRLRTDHDLSEVSVRLDERARAAVDAAPPTGTVSKRVPAGRRAVSVSTLVPTGLARGDEVTVTAADAGADADAPGDEGASVSGTVVSAKSGDETPSSSADDVTPETVAAGTADADPAVPAPTAPVTRGGEGRITVAVTRADAATLLRTTEGDRDPRVAVASRGTRREFELVGLLRRAGQRVRRFTVRPGSALDGATLGDASVRESYGVAVLAVRTGDEWRLAPGGIAALSAGADVFAVGPSDALAAFEGAVS